MTEGKTAALTTGTGLAALIGGGYLLGLGLAGLNADVSTGAKWAFGLVFVIGFVIAGWATILPWDAKERRESEQE
jgi:hypothetical protein